MRPIKLHANLLDSEEFEDEYRLKMLIFLLLKAKQRAAVYRGVHVRRGQVVAGRGFISKGTGITEAVVRTRMKWMELSETIAVRVHDVDGFKFSVITINNYAEYQQDIDIPEPEPKPEPDPPPKKEPTPYMQKQQRLGRRAFSDDFNEWWDLYRKGVKRNAWIRWQQHKAMLPELDELMKNTQQYIAYCKSIDREMMDGQGWLNQGYYETEWTHEAQGTKPEGDGEDVKFG